MCEALEAPVPVPVLAVDAGDPEVVALVDALDAELAASGYAEDESFGYDVERLAAGTVHLVGARAADGLVGLGGLEVPAGTSPQEGTAAELKRFYVAPSARGSGVADVLLDALLRHADEAGVEVVRLETGVHQHAALAFYRRRGFVDVPRFGPYVGSGTSVCLARRLP